MAHFCPITGLEVFSLPEWVNQKVSDTLIANFWVIGNLIIYSLPKGRADLKGAQNSLALNKRVASYISGGNGPYIQLEDYAFLKGTSTAARRYFASRLNNDRYILSLIFCNLSSSLSIAVKIGSRLNTTGKEIHVAMHYGDAVKRAIELSGQENLKTGSAPINLSKYISPANPSLSPVEVLSEDAWNIQTPEYCSQAVVIDQCIFHTTSEGYTKSKHMPLIEHVRSMCQSAVSEDSNLKYFIVDASRFKNGNRSARSKYTQALKSWHQRFPLRMYIVYGANKFFKTTLHLAKPMMPFKVKIAKDIDHAFQLIHKDRSGDFSKKHEIKETEKPVVAKHGDIEKLLAMIGSINWEQEGVDVSFDINEDHPFYFLYQSIKLIKEELDDLFNERKRLEKQLLQSRKMESISTLVGGIAHDFNNLLHKIIGNAELATYDIPELNPAHDHLEEIKAAGLKAANIVKQLLNFSHQTEQELKPIGAIAIIKNVLKFLRSAIPTTIEIRKRLPDKEVTILADQTQINQILMNLCTNASQAMEETGGHLEIMVENVIFSKEEIDSDPDLIEGDYLKITVSDTGPGIDNEIIDRIFDPYFTTKDFGKYSGMGLAIVRGIVKNHGGSITVDSQVGKGATFTMFFPAVTEEPVMEVKTPDEILGGNETILFVDDEESIVEMTQKILERLGYRVETRSNPVEALELFQSNPYEFDLVITDMTMPQMTGVKLSEKLKGICADIPVIICTGHSSLIDEEKAKDLRIDAFVMKPIIIGEIAKTIRKVIGNLKKV